MEENIEKRNCPICGQECGFYQVTFKEPYIHQIPFEGLMIYGAFSSPKETICYQDSHVHFAFMDAEGNLIDHRLVELGVENAPSYYPVMIEEEDDDDFNNGFDDWDDADWQDCEDDENWYEREQANSKSDDFPF